MEMKELKTYAVHFCGIGGACAGMHNAGLECRLAIDWWDKAIEFREKNLGHKGFHMDISKYDEIEKDEHAADLLWTSPPCQTFSSAARETAKFKSEDIRNNLFLASLYYIKKFTPQFFVLENVPGLLTHDNGKTIGRMNDEFRAAGYYCEQGTFTSEEFGLPQKRERVFIIGCRKEFGLKGLFPKPPKGIKKQVLSDIKEAGRADLVWAEQTYVTAYEKVRRTDVEIQIIKNDGILPTITCGWGGGATRKKVGISDSISIPGQEKPVNFVRHPSVREGARAQGFPDTWVFPESSTDAWQGIGNAVSTPVAEAIVNHLKLLSKGEKAPHLSVKNLNDRNTRLSAQASDGQPLMITDILAKMAVEHA